MDAQGSWRYGPEHDVACGSYMQQTQTSQPDQLPNCVQGQCLCTMATSDSATGLSAIKAKANTELLIAARTACWVQGHGVVAPGSDPLNTAGVAQGS